MRIVIDTNIIASAVFFFFCCLRLFSQIDMILNDIAVFIHERDTCFVMRISRRFS